ncbi:peptidase inhibitor family I36 protein [Streptomyces sp. NPDC015242]|uniref:peptidase inhibitor family I36 protein n=1 Tax=Streptomyces sp. NPDC015242 TaxID=3364951 RepID=UPI0036FC6FC7
MALIGKTTATLVGTASALALAFFGAAPAAQASAGVQAETCPVDSGYACFWVNNYRGGTMGKVSGDNENYRNLSNSSGCTRYPGTWNDCISSVENQGRQCTVYFWTDANYQGRYHSLSIGDRVNDMAVGWNDASFNDAISSNHWCSPR